MKGVPISILTTACYNKNNNNDTRISHYTGIVNENLGNPYANIIIFFYRDDRILKRQRNDINY